MEERDKQILRELAHKVAELAHTEENAEKAKAWQSHNDLKKGARAMILCDPENGWNEIFPAKSFECEDGLVEFGTVERSDRSARAGKFHAGYVRQSG